MSCTVKDRLIDTIRSEIKGNATSYKLEANRVFIPFTQSRFIKTLEQAVKIAQSKVAAINKKYYASEFGNVVSTDTTPRNGVYINIHPTQALIDAYEIEEDRKSAEEAEREIQYTEDYLAKIYEEAMNLPENQIQERIKECK